MKKIYKVYEGRAEVTKSWFNRQHIKDESDWRTMLFENTGYGEDLFSEPEKEKFYWTLEEAENDYNNRTVATARYDDYHRLWIVEGKMLEVIEYDESEYGEDVTFEENELDSLFVGDGLECEWSPYPMSEEEEEEDDE